MTWQMTNCPNTVHCINGFQYHDIINGLVLYSLKHNAKDIDSISTGVRHYNAHSRHTNKHYQLLQLLSVWHCSFQISNIHNNCIKTCSAMWECQGHNWEFTSGREGFSPLFLSFPFPLLFLPFPLPFPSPQSGPLNPTRDLGECCKFCLQGPEQDPGCKCIHDVFRAWEFV